MSLTYFVKGSSVEVFTTDSVAVVGALLTLPDWSKIGASFKTISVLLGLPGFSEKTV